MRTRFYLEKRNDPEGRLMTVDRPVLMSVTFNGKRIMLGTGIRVDMNGWDPAAQRVKMNYPGAPGLNGWLETLEDTAQKSWKAIRTDGLDPGETFKETFRRVKPSYSTGFFQVFYEFLESGTSQWSMTTYRKARTIYNHLREFEERTGHSISFRTLDRAFLPKFTAFYAEKGNNLTTTRKAINILVWFLNWSTGKGYNVYHDYRDFYKMLENEPAGKPAEPICLQWEEVMRLLDFQPSGRKMERVRDQFCFMCLSGLRFSEIRSLRKEDINDREIVVRRNNGRTRKVHMNHYTRNIYRYYENRYYLDNAAFPSMSIITFNKYLRLLGKEAGLDREIPAQVPRADQTSLAPLHEHLTSGIARNTFIANALQLEIPA